MKMKFIMLFALILAVFMMNSAMASSSDCGTTADPIYTDTGTSIR